MRTLARALLARLGLEVHRSSRWGDEIWRDLRRLVSRDGGEPLIIDVGAHHGAWAQQALRQFPRAHLLCVEPNPDSVEVLQRGLGKDDRVSIEACACGPSEGRSTLMISRDTVGSSLLAFNDAVVGRIGEWSQPAGSIEVPVKRLDSLVRSLAWTSVDLLKVDAQGYDLEVLKSGGEFVHPATVKSILVEVNFTSFYEGQCSAGELMDFLLHRGYLPVGMYDGARNPDARLGWSDLIVA